MILVPAGIHICRERERKNMENDYFKWCHRLTNHVQVLQYIQVQILCKSTKIVLTWNMTIWTGLSAPPEIDRSTKALYRSRIGTWSCSEATSNRHPWHTSPPYNRVSTSFPGRPTSLPLMATTRDMYEPAAPQPSRAGSRLPASTSRRRQSPRQGHPGEIRGPLKFSYGARQIVPHRRLAWARRFISFCRPNIACQQFGPKLAVD
jgi:hypothetical protein